MKVGSFCYLVRARPEPPSACGISPRSAGGEGKWRLRAGLLRPTTKDATTRLAVNGLQQVSQNAVVSLDQLDGDILITLSNAAGARSVR